MDSLEKKIKHLAKVFEEEFPEIAFAYLFGSMAEGKAKKSSDTDIAVYLKPYKKSPELIAKIIGSVENVFDKSPCDLLILNDAGVLIAKEAIKGKIVFIRKSAMDDYAGFYSIICRKYEDKIVWMKKQLEYRGYEVQWDN